MLKTSSESPQWTLRTPCGGGRRYDRHAVAPVRKRTPGRRGGGRVAGRLASRARPAPSVSPDARGGVGT
eukprot:gene21643-biopygen20680